MRWFWSILAALLLVCPAVAQDSTHVIDLIPSYWGVDAEVHTSSPNSRAAIVALAHTYQPNAKVAEDKDGSDSIYRFTIATPSQKEFLDSTTFISLAGLRAFIKAQPQDEAWKLTVFASPDNKVALSDRDLTDRTDLARGIGGFQVHSVRTFMGLAGALAWVVVPLIIAYFITFWPRSVYRYYRLKYEFDPNKLEKSVQRARRAVWRHFAKGYVPLCIFFALSELVTPESIRNWVQNRALFVNAGPCIAIFLILILALRLEKNTGKSAGLFSLTLIGLAIYSGFDAIAAGSAPLLPASTFFGDSYRMSVDGALVVGVAAMIGIGLLAYLQKGWFTEALPPSPLAMDSEEMVRQRQRVMSAVTYRLGRPAVKVVWAEKSDECEYDKLTHRILIRQNFVESLDDEELACYLDGNLRMYDPIPPVARSGARTRLVVMTLLGGVVFAIPLLLIAIKAHRHMPDVFGATLCISIVLLIFALPPPGDISAAKTYGNRAYLGMVAKRFLFEGSSRKSERPPFDAEVNFAHLVRSLTRHRDGLRRAGYQVDDDTFRAVVMDMRPYFDAEGFRRPPRELKVRKPSMEDDENLLKGLA